MLPRAANPDRLLAWMESLSDPVRIRILRLLERHELGVNELCDIIQLPQSTVSRHLKMLLEQQWVKSRRQGTTHLYRMILDELAAPARKLWLVTREQTETWPTAGQDQIRLDSLLAKKQTDSQAFFAGAAAEWDRIRGELYGNAFTMKALLALLPPDTVIADLGCGSGGVSEMVAPFVRKVIAVDNSPAMLKAARRRLEHLPNVEIRRGELAALPLEDDSCSAVLVLLVLTYVADVPLALREMHRILQPGGRAILVDLLPHDRDDFRRQLGQVSLGFDPGDFRATLLAAGFKDGVIQPLPAESNVKGPALFLAVANK
ncbi:MAG: metalloregulator ArsR/SmtB family transcription factor [Phycisphaerae bacterium]|nr:metalloregulator ArsR/SmtB family transcription factor [Phycisphaerae bacterium]MDW8262621.1 metalloregulator ArsR/SmtB family transcription factor [Phycisphaerales bacterium]